MRSTKALFGLVFVLALAAVVAATWDADADARDRGGCGPAGTWVFPNGTETFVRTGDTFQFHFDGDGTNDWSVGGQFPGAMEPNAGILGEIRRLRGNVWAFRGISPIVAPSEDGGFELAYIGIHEGTVTFDCDVQEGLRDFSVFLPEQDADGDGLPDEGEEPVIFAPDNPFSARRLTAPGGHGDGDDDD